jgi:hypothetical protein
LLLEAQVEIPSSTKGKIIETMGKSWHIMGNYMNFMEVSIGTSSTEEFSSKPCLITRWYINWFFCAK